MQAKEHAWGEQKIGENWEGVSEKGGGGVGGRKLITCSQFQTFYRTLFAHERGAVVQFDQLLARQSKYDIRNLSFMHNPTSGTQQDQGTSKDLSQNGKLIVVNPEQEAAISLVRRQPMQSRHL